MTGIPMTSTQQKELQDFRASLSEELLTYFDRVIEEEGEEAVLSKLGHLKAQAEYIESL
jgi:hypothetical protein